MRLDHQVRLLVVIKDSGDSHAGIAPQGEKPLGIMVIRSNLLPRGASGGPGWSGREGVREHARHGRIIL